VSDQIQQLISQLSGETRQKNRAISQLIRIGSEAVDALIDALAANSQLSTLQGLMLILSKIGDQRAVSSLTTYLNSTDSNVCHSAANALLRLGAAEPFLDTAHSENIIGRKEESMPLEH
jgi:HEAT repeat protein